MDGDLTAYASQAACMGSKPHFLVLPLGCMWLPLSRSSLQQKRIMCSEMTAGLASLQWGPRP